jgi:hypothetical protein
LAARAKRVIVVSMLWERVLVMGNVIFRLRSIPIALYVLASLSLTSQAGAAPTQIVQKGDITVYLVPETVKQVTANVRSGERILSYVETRYELDSNYNEDHSKPFLSVVKTDYFDCAAGMIADGGMIDHAGPMGEGAVVHEYPNTGLPPPNLFMPLSLSDYDKITRPVFDAICGQKL